ncbi:MAG: diguanylate cyclase domain protein [Frankiales bacterium]|nr:diguanylate cyclase domain protein [Frankiales bacterium]
MLDAAAAQLSAWERSGCVLSCAVNLSARDLAAPGLLAGARAAVARHGLAPHRLCLELTETAILEDPVRAHAVLRDLSSAGFRLSLDDFGPGYTSLGQLRDLPLDELKLDRAFVAGMADHVADRAVVRAVVELAHSVGLEVVAEGVETAEQARVLRDSGYDLLQGWHVGRPVPADLLLLPVPVVSARA